MFEAGINPTNVRTSAEGPEFALGTIAFASMPSGQKGYMYVNDSGSGITGDGYVVDIDGSAFTAVMSTTTTTAPGAGAGKAVGVARAAIPANGYGWVQIFGPGTVRVLASAVLYTKLNSTATAGTLDDDATAGSEVIDGIVLDATNGGSTANVAAWINWPTVGRTL